MLTCARGKSILAREPIWSSVMENQTQKKVYLHYNHTDSCNYARWTARCIPSFSCFPHILILIRTDRVDPVGYPVDSLSFLRRRSDLNPLPRPFSMEKFVQDVAESSEACEETELAHLSTKDKTGRWARVTFKILLSYHGGSFDGWQKQPGLNTVQGLVEKSIGRFVDEKKAQKLKDKCLPLEGSALVAGRTDKGVTALKQVCAFYTWRKDVKAQDVEDAINNGEPGKLRVISVSEVSRAFHPNFSAKWRRYFYIFPLNDGKEKQCTGGKRDENPISSEQHLKQINGCAEYLGEEDGCLAVEDESEFESGKKPRSFSIHRVNQLLLQLEGKSLSYKMFARDTKASRSTGPPTECFIYHARATEARLPCVEEVHGEGGKGSKIMCVELVGNRFLRKMVRVLVATSIREAAAGADDDALLKLMDATCRRATAPPAPPDGLCLVDVGYEEFNPENCLIL